MDTVTPLCSPGSVAALSLGLPLHTDDDEEHDQTQKSFAAHYEEHAARHWDNFYQAHQRNFFKDRHYLDREFPCLLQRDLVLLEVWLFALSSTSGRRFDRAVGAT